MTRVNEVLSSFSDWNTGTSNQLSSYGSLTTMIDGVDEILANIENDVIHVNACLQEKIRSSGSLPNTISATQEQILKLNDQITQEESNAAIARDRVAYIRNPATATSNYESWFPLGRPMQPISIMILLGITIFICVFGLLMAGSAVGIDLSVAVVASSKFDSLYSQVSYPSMILVGLLILFITLYATRTYAT